MQAVAEGNDPPAQSVVHGESHERRGIQRARARLQRNKPNTLTQNIKALAAQNQIPTIGVTETIQPPNTLFQVWMGAELIALQDALNAQALGHLIDE